MQYQTGTVSVTNASATVNGTGTEWTSELTSGDAFLVQGDSVTYTVASINSDTSLSLTAPYAGSTDAAASYAVTRSFTSLGIPEFAPGDIGTAALLTRAMRLINDKLVDLGAS